MIIWRRDIISLVFCYNNCRSISLNKEKEKSIINHQDAGKYLEGYSGNPSLRNIRCLQSRKYKEFIVVSLFKACPKSLSLRQRTFSVENEKTGSDDIPALVSCKLRPYFK